MWSSFLQLLQSSGDQHYKQLRYEPPEGTTAAAVYDAIEAALSHYKLTLAKFGIDRPLCDSSILDTRTFAQRELDAELPTEESMNDAMTVCDSLVLNAGQSIPFDVIVEELDAMASAGMLFVRLRMRRTLTMTPCEFCRGRFSASWHWSWTYKLSCDPL